jgi:biotin transporter BioY
MEHHVSRKVPVIVFALALPITFLLNWGLVEMGLVTTNKLSSILWGLAVFFPVAIVLMCVAAAILIRGERARLDRLRRADEDADRASAEFPG